MKYPSKTGGHIKRGFWSTKYSQLRSLLMEQSSKDIDSEPEPVVVVQAPSGRVPVEKAMKFEERRYIAPPRNYVTDDMLAQKMRKEFGDDMYRKNHADDQRDGERQQGSKVFVLP